ncbi:hypothetical protein N7490_011083 [Penicillium lividum]|nr:hypothetical protein N7490_011083 [Penicillium lividum]
MSSIWPSVLMDITSHNSTALAIVISAIAGVNGTLVFATAFHGTSATSVANSTTTAAASTVPLTSSITASSYSCHLYHFYQLYDRHCHCGQNCFDNTLAEYESLGCSTSDPSCLCRNINFYYGIHDCSNAVCGTDVASTVLALKAVTTTYPVIITVTVTATAMATPTAVSDLSTCSQTCFDNMLAQYATLGCNNETDASCLCENINFYFGLRDCSDQACDTDEATAVLAYEIYYCVAATASSA